MPSKYRRHIGIPLKEKLDEFMDGGHHEQIQLYEELAIVRAMAVNALKLAEPVLQPGRKKIKAHIQVIALDLLAECMENVRKMVETIAKMEKLSDGKVSLRVVDMLLAQVIKLLHKKYPDDGDELEVLIRDIRLPEADHEPGGGFTQGTEITPDAMVTEMDESILGEA